MGQAGAGENGQLLAPHQGVQPVDGGDARLDKLVGVVPGGGVHGQAVDVPVLVGQDGGAAVDGLAHAVEHPAQHIPGHPQLEGVPQESDFRFRQVDAGGVLKELDHGGVSVDLQHLAPADGAIAEFDLPQLVIGDPPDPVHHHQRAGDLLNRLIFPDHSALSPFWAAASSSSSISRSMAA